MQYLYRILLRVSYFLISVTKLWDMIICLHMCNGRTHHALGLESKSRFKTANTCDYCLPITVKWESKSNISDEINKQILREWRHMSHRKSSLSSIHIWLNDVRHVAFTHVSNCITLRTDLVRMVVIFEAAYGMSWKSSRSSWIRKGKEVELYLPTTSDMIYLP